MGPQRTDNQQVDGGPASLLIALAKAELATGREILDRPSFDGHTLQAFSRLHGLSGLLYAHLDDLGGRIEFTEEDLGRLRRFHDYQVKSARQTATDLVELLDLFAGIECEVILLKGLYLAQRFYGGIDKRIAWDTDLLVPAADFERAQRLLEEAGFSRISTMLLGKRLSRRFVHGFDFQRRSCKVDLHWALTAHPAITLDYDRMWSTARQYEIGDLAVRVLADDLMIATTLVSSFEDLQRGALRLRTLVDLYKILQTLEPKTDWPMFFTDRDREGLRKISASMLTLVVDTLDAADEFPTLTRELARQRQQLPAMTSAPTQPLDTPSFAIGRKRWASGLYDMSRIRLFGWWLISLPFRISVYQSDKIRRRLARLGARRGPRGAAT